MSQHPALAAVGLRREGELWSWEADGPVLLPPELETPYRSDPRVP